MGGSRAQVGAAFRAVDQDSPSRSPARLVSGVSGPALATAARASHTPCWTVRWRTRGQRVRPQSRATPWTTKARRSTARWPMSALRKLFEDAGFTKAADTNAVSGGFRASMRLELLTNFTARTPVGDSPTVQPPFGR